MVWDQPHDSYDIIDAGGWTTRGAAMRLNIKSDVKRGVRRLERIGSNNKYATMLAINGTLYHCRNAMINEIDQKVDRPTNFTRQAFKYDKALKARLVGVIYLREINKYLTGLIYGGTETKKHQVIGKRYPDNRYGNLPRGATKKPKTFSATIQGQPGVWQRMGTKKNPKVRLVAHFPRARSYKPTIKFEQTCDKTARLRFASEYRKGVKKAFR
jgi:hypothetical protein